MGWVPSAAPITGNSEDCLYMDLNRSESFNYLCL